MFEDYDDMFASPSEADLIIEKAKSDLAELLTDSVKEMLAEKAEAESRLKELRDQLSKIECDISQANKRYAEAHERLENAELRDIPRKYIAKFVRNVIGDYTVGDTVWTFKYLYNRSECPTCNGAKKDVATINGCEERIACPTCSGCGTVQKESVKVEETKIREICLKLCFEGGGVTYWSTDSIFLGKNERSTDLKHIFATKEEAEAALSRRTNNG